jgi:ribosome-associated protein
LDIKNTEEKEILESLLNLLDTKKALQITAIDIAEISSIAKYIIIVTANSSVHSKTLAKNVINYFIDNKFKNLLLNKNIDTNNPWILIDATDFIINIFLPETREFYNLEKIFFKGNKIIDS